MTHHDFEHPPVRPSVRSTFQSPFEMALTGMCVLAIAVFVLAVALLLTDTGIVNW